MSTASSDSSMEMGLEPVPVGGPGDGSPAADGAIWLDGEVLACSCPDCGAPMSIRLWLMVADCFRCGASIELTEQQEQEALRLLREQEEVKRADSREAVAAISPTVLRKPRPSAKPEVARPTPDTRSQPAPAPAAAPAAVPRQRPRRVAASQIHRGARAHIRDIYEKGGIAVFLSQLFKDLPAWLVSMVIHLVAILLLGLWIDQPFGDARSITLATSVSDEDLAGDGDEIEQTPVQSFEFEDPGAIRLNNVVEEPGAPTEAEVDLEPVDVPLVVPDPVGNLPSSVSRRTFTMPPVNTGRMFAGRDPQARAHRVQQAGGTSATEAAVARGLVFLARHQSADGRWSLHAFHRTPDCDETCRDRGHATKNDVAGTALALLPFLGAGQTHQQGQYTSEVGKGLKWLVEQQKENGDLRGAGERITQMYAHGQASIVLCEAYALTGDEQLREPAQMAINFIIRAQHHEGGWRYQPGDPGDTSVVGWQLMALKSGQMAYLHVPRRTFEKAGLFLDRVQVDRVGGRYGYQRGQSATPAMTAEAMLCRQYLGWPKDHRGLRSGVNYLLGHLPDADSPNIYYWYYATQVMHHFGGKPWEEWNAAMREALVKMQEKTGHAAGSWTPRGSGNHGGHADRGGRVYMTSLAVCILEVYYRHMPLYGTEALEGLE